MDKTIKICLMFMALALPLSVAGVSFAAEDTVSTPEVDPPAASSSESEPPVESEPPIESALPTIQAEGTLSPMPEAMDQSIVPLPGGIEDRISLDLRNIEITEALRFLAQKGGLNLVISKNVQGRVQLQLSNVPIKDVLDILLVANQLAYEQAGEIYYVMTEPEYKERYGRKFSDIRKVKVFHLKYAIPDQAFSLFEALKSEIGRLLVDPESGTVLIMDTQENIDRMELALEGLEKKRSVKVYGLKYAKALEVETRLKTQLDSKKVGAVVSDERTNQLMVETLPDRMTEIDELVKALDQKTREVLIDAKIVKVTFSDNYHAEIQWEGIYNQITSAGQAFASNHPFSALARTGTSFVDNFVNIPPTARPTQGAKNVLTENLYLGTVGEDSFETLINFLKTLGETKVLSNPKLVVVNNQEAKIHVGEKQAYVTTTTTTGQTTTTTAETVTFIDVGIALAVTPTINEDGYVTMKIKPEVSSVASFLTTPSGNKIPIIDRSLAETSVMVKDGISIVIGGLRRDEKVTSNKKVPFLGDIPLLGLPFNSSNSQIRRAELLIIITPHVVYGDELIVGDRKAAESPLMSYTDYNPLGPLSEKEMKAMLKSAPPAPA